MSFISRNPYNGEEYGSYPFHKAEELTSGIDKCHKAFLNWKELSFEERGNHFLKLADLLDKRKDELARIITEEMGKVIRESRAELEKSALTARYYASAAEGMLKLTPYESYGHKAEVVYQPVGVVFGIFPWNFPFWQVLRFAIPTMMAGNTAVFKHAENVPRSALAIEELFRQAGFPKNALVNLFSRIEDSELIISNEKVRAVTLTGSERAGRSVASLAGKHLKKVVLELGGSDPFIVLPGADIKAAAKIGVLSRYQNTGQSCIAAKRFIIHDDLYDSFLDAFREEMGRLKPGNPLDEATTLGVIAREDLCENLDRQVNETVSRGANRVMGAIKTGDVSFEPGILENVRPGTPAYSEELFGPVASFFRVKSPEEALNLANDTRFGLSAAVWAGDLTTLRETALKIESGMVYLNSMSRSTPELPFGGFKNSGIGRELSPLGIKEFTNPKTLFPLR